MKTMPRFVLPDRVSAALALCAIAAGSHAADGGLGERVAAAHGGLDRWREVRSVSMEREHHFLRDEKPFLFRIVGEESTGRIFQQWHQPAGEVAWDGERAWSNDWGFAGRFSERFTTGIGYFLASLPLRMTDDDTELLSVTRQAGVIPGDTNEYVVAEIEYEAGPVRKPAAFDGRRDRFRLVIDPQTHRVAAVVEMRSYAGQLDISKAPAEQEHFEDIFVIESYAEAGGLVWPEAYALYTLDGRQYGKGRFFDYRVNVPFDEAWMQPRPGTSRFDTTSSYRRVPTDN